MTSQDFVWLAADYHFPLTYCIRVPMSSPNSALAMPAPGSATVRLAMVRSGFELFDEVFLRDVLYPIIRSAEIHIRPPSRVGISTQLLQGYKVTGSKSGDHWVESPIYREVSQADGVMTVYIRVPTSHLDSCREILEIIGYWGRTDSLTYCLDVTTSSPKMSECATPLATLNTSRPIRNLFSCLVSDFRDANVKWDEIMPVLSTKKITAIRHQIWVWPMIIIEQRSNHKLLERRSLVL